MICKMQDIKKQRKQDQRRVITRDAVQENKDMMIDFKRTL